MNAAQVAWKQIPTMTKMACGARNAHYDKTGNELTFKVGGKPMRYITVAYVPGRDTYDVVHFRVKRNDYSRVELERATDVYADGLGEVIYHQVNK